MLSILLPGSAVDRREIALALPAVTICHTAFAVLRVVFLSAFVVPIANAGETLEWGVTQTTGSPQVTAQRMREDDAEYQRFRCDGTNRAAFVEFSGPIKPSLLHDDFEATLRLRTNVPGVRFGLRVIFPQQVDPRTGEPLETILRGTLSRDTDEWQTLRVSGDRAELQTHVRRLRAELHRPDLDTRQAIATGLALLIELSPDTTFVDIRDCDYGPIVRVPDQFAEHVAAAPSAAEPPVAGFVPLKVELNRIVLGEKPVLLRFAPDHGESVDTLTSLRLNAVWVPDYRNTDRASQLYELGMAVIATPPHPEFEPGDYRRLIRALPPLDALCPHASAWYTGTRVPREQLAHLLSLSREVRSADRRYQRPHMADVVNAEGAASREIDLIGVGRHVVGRCESFGELRNNLYQRQRLAGQLTFPWTWIQTEPSGTQQRYRAVAGSLQPTVEPEQILLQMQAAISAGCKGIGFWKTRQLDPTRPEDKETLLAIELASLQLTLLEPFIAEGRLDGHLQIQSDNRRVPGPGAADDDTPLLKSALDGRRTTTSVALDRRPSGPDAAVITSGPTMLILMTHWDNESQYVPTPMFYRNAELVVAASETASAWRIGPSGIEGLPRRVTAGGLVVRIQDFDQRDTVIVSSDPELIRALDRRILQQVPRSAAVYHELSRLKLERVEQTIARIQQHITPPVSTVALLSRAGQAVRSSTSALRREDYRECIASAETALRLTRECQYLCWHQAVDTLICPTASPHTISFSTLPDHWAMVNAIRDGRAQESGNLLQSGTFENTRLLTEGDWQRERTESEDWLSAADVVRIPGRANSVLRLACWRPAQNAPRSAGPADSVLPLVVKSPEIQVQAGDILRCTGKIRLGRGISPDRDRPALLFDSVLGPEHGVKPDFLSALGHRDLADQRAGRQRLLLRDRYNRDWIPFEFFREARQSGPFQLCIAVATSAELHLDDVSVTRIPSPDHQPAGPVQTVGHVVP